MNIKHYNESRKQAKKARCKALKNYGKTAVHVVLNNQEIERRYFVNYSDAQAFCDEVNSGTYIKGAYAFTNY